MLERCFLFYLNLLPCRPIYILHILYIYIKKIIKWKNAIESKILKVILWKTKVTASGDIRMDGLSKTKVEPHRVYSL